MKELVFATRPSALARWQTNWVIAALKNMHPGLVCREKVITTQGDKILDKPLPEIGGKGLFTQELESELLNGSVDCAVHSLKDLPVQDQPGLVIGCIPARAEVRDAWISLHRLSLRDLPTGAIVGTSSLRRSAQLLAIRPDLQISSLRGNVDTRLRKAEEGQYAAIVLAGAGLLRLGLESHVTGWLSLEEMLPAPGQGALAVQCRVDDEETLAILAGLEHAATRQAVTAERQFLAGLGGGCSVPVAAFASCDDDEIALTGLVIQPDGRSKISLTGSGNDAAALGQRLAQDALALGARQILQPV